jgi:Na+:H+ antiporter, NhaA family
VLAGLVLGTPIGVPAATWLVQRLTKAQLAEGLSWWDVLGLAAHRHRLHRVPAHR